MYLRTTTGMEREPQAGHCMRRATVNEGLAKYCIIDSGTFPSSLKCCGSSVHLWRPQCAPPAATPLPPRRGCAPALLGLASAAAMCTRQMGSTRPRPGSTERLTAAACTLLCGRPKPPSDSVARSSAPCGIWSRRTASARPRSPPKVLHTCAPQSGRPSATVIAKAGCNAGH